MKQQKYPKTRIGVGTILYAASLVEVENKGLYLNIAKHEVSSIRAGKGNGDVKARTLFVHLIERVEGVTWKKRSSKHGDFGWGNSIQDWMRTKFQVGDDLPTGIYTTKLAALRHAKYFESKKRQRFQKWEREENTSYHSILIEIDKRIAIIERAIKREIVR